MLDKFRRVMDRAQKVLISTPEALYDNVRGLVYHDAPDADIELIGVDNTYNDWSGFLALLTRVTASRLILANDSIINRRLIRTANIEELASMVESAARPSLIGEVDTAHISVPVGGYSSTAWVSSYLVGMYLPDSMNAKRLASILAADCHTIPPHTREFFLDFLRKYRRDILNTNPDGGGKLHSMYLERLLTHVAATNQIDIVSQYGGGGYFRRKVYRLMEITFL
jgi:hypothetical protein